MPHAVRKIDQQIRTTLKAIELLENAGAREFVALVNRLRQEVVLAVVEAGGLDRFTVSWLKQRIGRITDDFDKRFADLVSANERRLFVKGIQIVDNAVKGAELRAAVPYLSENTLVQVQNFTATLITNLTDYARHRITQELDLAVLGQKPQTEVVRAIGRDLTSPSIFGTVARRAETIFRTEVNRVQNLSAAERIKQVSQVVPDLQKEWMHSHQGVPRPNHLAMNGTIIDAAGRFTLIGRYGDIYKIQAPLDPILPAEEAVNCRCQALPVVGRYKELGGGNRTHPEAAKYAS